MTDGEEAPKEFPKKQEDRICPNWRTCEIIGCTGHQPHKENHECGLGHQPMTLVWKKACSKSKPCIQIPDKYPNNGGE